MPDVAQPCGDCGHTSWDTANPIEVPSLVFLRAAVVSTTFVSFPCVKPGCAGLLLVEGIEFGLLRRTPGLAYGHCLLYAWADLMTASGGAKWWRFWRDSLSAYKE
jgi:hypothetical protein